MIVNEIFSSIDGEGIRQGELATFIRFAGCNLRCSYCDTKYAQKEEQGTKKSVDEIISIISKLKNRNITITGGEPLLQPKLLELVKKLVELGYYINIETNGSINIKPFQLKNVIITMDYKTSSSLMINKMKIQYLNFLRPQDVLKFVIGTKEDMKDVKRVLKQVKIKSYIYLSPVFNEIEPSKLVDFLKGLNEEGIDTSKTRVQIQLHKVIWDSEMRGV